MNAPVKIEPRASRLTMGEYVRRRNGVPLGGRGALGNMLRRSLGAGSFAGFWRYWNPIFGYALGRFVYAPIRRVIPAPLALVTTFVACGALHDAVTMALRGSVTLLFTPWFLLLGIGVVAGRAAGMDTSDRPWAVRAGVNLVYLGSCLAVTLALRRALSLP